MNKVKFLPQLSAYFDVELSLDDVLSWVSDVEWKDALIGKTDEQSSSSVLKEVRDASVKGLKGHLDKINPIIEKYINEYSIENGLENLEQESCALVKYTEGQFFSEHSDGGEFVQRRLSMVLYLNDDYDGGEIVFTKFRNTIKPKANTLILFPPTEEYSHAAQPVVSGTKYALIGFWK